MSTRRNMKTKRRNSKKNKTSRNKKFQNKTGKKWTTAIEAAQKTLKQTHSIIKANKELKYQALVNARKLFGSIKEQH